MGPCICAATLLACIVGTAAASDAASPSPPSEEAPVAQTVDAEPEEDGQTNPTPEATPLTLPEQDRGEKIEVGTPSPALLVPEPKIDPEPATNSTLTPITIPNLKTADEVDGGVPKTKSVAQEPQSAEPLPSTEPDESKRLGGHGFPRPPPARRGRADSISPIARIFIEGRLAASGMTGITGYDYSAFTPALTLGILAMSGLGFGLGVALGHVDFGRPAFPPTTISMFTMTFSPTFYYLLPELGSEALRFVAKASLLIGFIDAPGSTIPTTGYLAAFTALYFPHPSFALGLEAGPAGFIIPASGYVENRLHVALTAMVFLGTISAAVELDLEHD